jgi:Zn finger protein HypA/HybF involved in hydrogenase expression
MDEERKRVKVRVERVDTKCGAVSHMTVDEIKERIIGENLNVTCPECGAIHLTREDAEEAATRRISASARFKKIVAEAEEQSP